MSLLVQRIDSVHFAVVDLETTGFNPEADRVVEIAVRRFNPADGSVEAFDSLVDPERPMRATQYHGIRQEHVRGAPTFRKLAPTIHGLLSNAVLAAYNVDYDARFLSAEFGRLGIELQVPQLCLMWLKPMLSLGPRCSLPDACDALGVPFNGTHHVAAHDAEAAQSLLQRYLRECPHRGVHTFGDLVGRGNKPRPLSPVLPVPVCNASSRRDWPAEKLAVPGTAAVGTYFDALVGMLADGEVTADEESHLADLQQRLHLTPEQIGALHARAYLCIAMNYIGDDWLDAAELADLRHIAASLQRLGWSPCE